MKTDKYNGLRYIYENYKDSLKLSNRKKNKRITYTEFKTVIHTYFEMVFEDLFRFGHETDIRTSLISGSFAIRKSLQKRTYHVLKDNEESKRQGRLVKYKVPILEDWFSRLLWITRNPVYGRLRVVFSAVPNREKKKFVKEKGYDNIKTRVDGKQLDKKNK